MKTSILGKKRCNKDVWVIKAHTPHVHKFHVNAKLKVVKHLIRIKSMQLPGLPTEENISNSWPQEQWKLTVQRHPKPVEQGIIKSKCQSNVKLKYANCFHIAMVRMFVP